MEAVKKENGIVVDHICCQEVPDGYEEVKAFYGYVGIPADAIDWETGEILQIEDLIEKGIVNDNRGNYWDKQTGELNVITEYDVDPADGWTNVAPLDDEPFQYWDENSGSWKVDEEAKELNEAAVKIQHLKSLLSAGDYKVIKALEAGVVLDDLYPGETALRQSYRDRINELEA